MREPKSAWTKPALFYMHVNSLMMIAIYLETKSTNVQQSTHPRVNHVCFGEMFPADSAYDLKVSRINLVEALRNVDKEKERYVDYSSEYSFPEAGAQ